VPFIPYWQVLSGQFNRRAVRGKIVVIGDTEPIFHDVHLTPTDDLMTGAEVQADAIDTVLNGFPLSPLASWVNVLLIVLLGMLAPVLALRISAVKAAAAAAGVVLLFALVCQLAFDSGTVVGFVVPVIAVAATTLTTLFLYGIRVVFEREQVRDAFARFVPESVVGEVLAQADGVRLGGVRRYATVLFSDLRGFTTFSERREPSETLDILNRYLTEMTDAILEHGGTLVSYMGDGIMAVFGAPLEQPDHADRALKAARDMLARLAAFNDKLRAEGHGDGFKMGIGLNSGEVMSGNVGSERRLEYTTIGDTTNTASRIEGMTKGTPYQLYLSETTYGHLSAAPNDLVLAGEFEIRGRERRIKIWALEETASGGQNPPPRGQTTAGREPAGRKR
jgi:adenylate cyclase